MRTDPVCTPRVARRGRGWLVTQERDRRIDSFVLDANFGSNMRRKVGIVVGACAAMVLAGTAGAAGWAYTSNDEGRPVGTWHEAPGVARKTAAGTEPAGTGRGA